MIKIVLAPYAAILPEGKLNPKNYPYWSEVVGRLNAQNCEIIQIGLPHESKIDGVGQFLAGWPLKELRKVIENADCWLSVDSWLPHFCATERLKGGVVVWSQSNPKIWGYPHNTNLLKSRDYLRKYQYAPWWDAEFDERAFVSADEIVEAVLERVRIKAA